MVSVWRSEVRYNQSHISHHLQVEKRLESWLFGPRGRSAWGRSGRIDPATGRETVDLLNGVPIAQALEAEEDAGGLLGSTMQAQLFQPDAEEDTAQAELGARPPRAGVVLPPFFEHGPQEQSTVYALNNCLGRRHFEASDLDAAVHHVVVRSGSPTSEEIERHAGPTPGWYSPEVVTTAVAANKRERLDSVSFRTVEDLQQNIDLIKEEDVYVGTG